MKSVIIKKFPAYRVCENGTIETRWRTGNFYSGFNLPDKWKPIKAHQNKKGYLMIDLRDGYGGKRKTYVHILVAEAFHGARPSRKTCVRHLDGNPLNNRPSNLAWGTYQENENDKRIHNTWDSRIVGKLTDDQREEIKLNYSKGIPAQKLAAEYSVSRPTITRLLNGTTWRKK